jgi:hypothetical protein
MDSNRKTAVAVGILFIIATVSPILSMVLISGSLDAADYLTAISTNDNRVIMGALFELIMAAAIFSIPVFLFSVLQKHSAGAARGYLIARIFEAIPLTMGAICLLVLVTLGRESVMAGATDASQFQPLGALLRSARDWTSLIGGQVIFSLTALILNWALYKSRVVPRLLSGWGLIGVPLMLAGGLLVLFGVLADSSTIQTILMLPLAVQEMVFALWLIFKGFSRSAIAAE